MTQRKYATVTTVSTFHHRYVVPMDQLQQFNTDATVSADWLSDSVVCNQVKEFSQTHLGELIIGADEISEEQALKLFDKENEYLSSWSPDKKIKYIENWKESDE